MYLGPHLGDLVLVGGPLTNSNPVPLAPFADVMILGEGEELIHTFLDAAAASPRQWRRCLRTASWYSWAALLAYYNLWRRMQ